MKTQAKKVKPTKIISEHQMLRLSLNDQALLIESLIPPPQPNQPLKNALDLYENYLSINKDKKW